MRIVHVITRLIIGGAQENTLATVHGLRQRPGIDVWLVSGPTYGPEGSLEADAATLQDHFIVAHDLIRPVHPLRDFLAIRSLRRIFRQIAPQIVHTHSGKAGFLGRLAAHQAGVPCIVHTIHGPSFGKFQGALANVLFRFAERLAGRVTTHFISVSNAMTRDYLAASIGRPEQYTRILSGFNLEPFLAARNNPELRKQLGIEPDDFVVGKIARLFKHKGHDELLEAAPAVLRKFPRTKFLLVGDGPWRGRLEHKAAEKGLARNFIFAGLVPPGRIPELVGIMDVLVHLSRREGLPRALPQAMAAGKPVVAWDCDGAAEVCLNETTGLLLPVGADVAPAILRLATDADLRERLGRAGCALARAQFGVEEMVAKIHDLYMQLQTRNVISNKPQAG